MFTLEMTCDKALEAKAVNLNIAVVHNYAEFISAPHNLMTGFSRINKR